MTITSWTVRRASLAAFLALGAAACSSSPATPTGDGSPGADIVGEADTPSPDVPRDTGADARQDARADAPDAPADVTGDIASDVAVDGAVEDGAIGDGAIGDGAIGDGAIGDGAIGDSAIGDSATVDSATVDSATVDSAIGDVPADVAADVPTDAVECTRSAECASSTGGPVCNAATNRCVACTATEDVCPTGNRCDAATNRCVVGCRGASDCAAAMTCDTTTHACVGCVEDANCAPGSVCSGHTCVPGCSPTHACGAGSTCCGTACVSTDNDRANCGACGNACATGSSCCGGACLDANTDPRNCGGCGTVCSLAHATEGCAAGACTVASCAAGFANCDGNAANGCEVGTAVDANNCGACGTRCAAPANATATCDGAACGFACNAGFGDCDGSAANGCETALTADVSHCGACATVCPARAHATATCAASACGLACATGFGNCDGDAANGCEADLGATPASCGACGRTCALPNAVAGCAAGACTIASCAAGFADCDGDAANGCETPTGDNLANCGACGNRCAMSDLCVLGRCVSVCPSSFTVCSGVCADTNTAVENCGACGRRCPSGPRSAALCTAGSCSITCVRGYGDCDGDPANGCEVDLGVTVTSCGACGRACDFPGATTACSAGACSLTACSTGLGNCDSDPTNGCETRLQTDLANCGACGATCAPSHGTGACASGVCAVAACDTGYADCDMDRANGCEVDVRSSNRNCGTCGTACPAGTACLGGVCSSECPRGTTFCSGACIDLNSDRLNCGRCGVRCGATQTCAAGACVEAPPSNDLPSAATTISLDRPSVDLTVTTTNATHDLDALCGDGGDADVFYRFTLTRRELVYVNTLGAPFDTILFFGVPDGAGGVSPLARTAAAGEVLCNDDARSLCTASGLTSQVVGLLTPGTYYLVVSGFGTSQGVTPMHIEHLAVGNGPVNVLPAGASTLSGTTAGTGTVSSGVCGGAGPENAYWWTTCPTTGAGAFTAEDCGTASFDTVLYVAHGDGVDNACNNDACGLQSRLSSTMTASARLHTLHVDGWLAADSGTYTVRVSRP